MAEDLVVVKDMPKSAGLRNAGEDSGVLYGPGKNILIPRRLAQALSLEFTEAARDEEGNILDPQPKPEAKAEAATPPAAGGAPATGGTTPPAAGEAGGTPSVAGGTKKKTATPAAAGTPAVAQPWTQGQGSAPADGQPAG